MHRPVLPGAVSEVTNEIGDIIFKMFSILYFLLIRLQEYKAFDYRRSK